MIRYTPSTIRTVPRTTRRLNASTSRRKSGAKNRTKIGAVPYSGEQWRTSGPDKMPRTLDYADVDWINDAVKPMLLAVPPRRAAELAMSIAEAADRVVAELPEEYVTLNSSAGSPINLLRAEHRREHLDEIEHALTGQAR